MRILTLHSKYRQHGGEDVSHAAEVRHLIHRGHEVLDVIVQNDDLASEGPLKQARWTTWNDRARKLVAESIARHRPAIMYVNNTFPTLSPAVYYAAFGHGVPVVQVLRNYRIGCLNGKAFRNGEQCHSCLGRGIPVPGVRHRCYNHSVSASSAVATMHLVHRALGTYRRTVSGYICISQYVQDFAVRSGIPRSMTTVRPNLVWPVPPNSINGGSDFLYVGRLQAEKGLRDLLTAFNLMATAGDRLVVVGSGEMENEIRQRTGPGTLIHHPSLNHGAVLALMRTARAVVVPSRWAEPFGRVAVEALASGTPVITYGGGGLSDIVRAVPRAATSCDPGSVTQLAQRMRAIRDSGNASYLELRHAARLGFDRSFAPERWYEATLDAFRTAGARDVF